ncbi:MAG: AEC family transporter [Ruminococcaceae bacterium]|nr:AEC family transporter [Oscillospiraceae bacterium]
MGTFWQNVFSAAQQVAILYIIVAVGFICDKTGLYTEKAAKLTNNLLFHIVTPAIIIQSFLTMEFNSENFRNLMMSFLGGTILHLAGALISLAIFNKHEPDTKAVYKFAVSFGNVGYMVLPLAQAVVGEEGVFFCSGVLIPFNIFQFTYGMYLMKGKGSFNAKSLIVNPGIISVAIGLPLFILSVKLPAIIMTPISHIASLNTPLAMLMFGTYLSKTELKKMFLRKETYAVAFIKLIIVPLISLAAYKLLGMTGLLLTSLTISASAPTATSTVMFATKYGRDNGAASQTIAVVSFLSIITMPVMIALAQAIG